MITCSDNAEELLRAAVRFDEDLRAGMSGVVEETCEEAADYARSVAPFQDHTGDLRRGIVGFLYQRTSNGAVGQIASVMPYSSYVEGGTPAHEIRPKEGQGFVGPLLPGRSRRGKGDIGTHRAALRWIDKAGLTRFASVVHHPGSKPYPFMGPAYLKAQGLLVAKGEVLLDRLVKRFA